MTKFARLKIRDWRQFSTIDLEMHPRLTVLTGANGAGKSTLMRIFSQHLGFNRPFHGLPVLGEAGVLTYFSGAFSRIGGKILRKISVKQAEQQRFFGEIEYTNQQSAQLWTPDLAGAQFHINIVNQQQIFGSHIDSHQPISAYRQVDSIPVIPITPNSAYGNYSSEVNQAYMGQRSNLSPMYRLKEAILSMAVFGEGNSEVGGNHDLLEFYLGFQNVLRSTLPDSLGFRGLKIQPPEVLLDTASGEFVIDAVSGGILALIDFSWRIYSFSRMHEEFVVTIDEPENHLHPSLQRELMPKLIAAFPSAQFIIATHSPFMVTAVKDASVYALKYDDFEFEDDVADRHQIGASQKVISVRLDSIKRASTVNEVLREVLGVAATMPAWAHQELDAILAQFQGVPPTAESVANLRVKLEAHGFDEFYPEALSRFVGVIRD